MLLAVLAQVRAVGVDHRGGVVVQARPGRSRTSAGPGPCPAPWPPTGTASWSGRRGSAPCSCRTAGPAPGRSTARRRAPGSTSPARRRPPPRARPPRACRSWPPGFRPSPSAAARPSRSSTWSSPSGRVPQSGHGSDTRMRARPLLGAWRSSRWVGFPDGHQPTARGRGLPAGQAALGVAGHHQASVRRLPGRGLGSHPPVGPPAAAHARARARRRGWQAVLPEGGARLRAGVDPDGADPRSERRAGRRLRRVREPGDAPVARQPSRARVASGARSRGHARTAGSARGRHRPARGCLRRRRGGRVHGARRVGRPRGRDRDQDHGRQGIAHRGADRTSLRTGRVPAGGGAPDRDRRRTASRPGDRRVPQGEAGGSGHARSVPQRHGRHDRRAVLATSARGGDRVVPRDAGRAVSVSPDAFTIASVPGSPDRPGPKRWSALAGERNRLPARLLRD